MHKILMQVKRRKVSIFISAPPEGDGLMVELGESLYSIGRCLMIESCFLYRCMFVLIMLVS
jgi:hypothetical protein